jgi:hypothetical protein
MSARPIPTLAEFLAAPIEEVARVAPQTAVYAAGGTRRRAVLEGIEPWSDAFLHWARQRLLSRIDMLFRHGIRNLFITTFTPENFREVNRYQAQMMQRLDWFVAGPETLADYKHFGWRVRLFGTEGVPELGPTADSLRRNTPATAPHTLYWMVVPDEESPWQQLLAAAHRAKAQTRAEVMRALYGEEIPPITLYLAFGKPMVTFTLIPPLLMGQLQCYWSQQPGYTLTEAQLRTILYDYAYLRPTWQAEKLERARAALAHRQAWEEGPTLGLGMRLGSFWYPAPMTSPVWLPNGEE